VTFDVALADLRRDVLAFVERVGFRVSSDQAQRVRMSSGQPLSRWPWAKGGATSAKVIGSMIQHPRRRSRRLSRARPRSSGSAAADRAPMARIRPAVPAAQAQRGGPATALATLSWRPTRGRYCAGHAGLTV